MKHSWLVGEKHTPQEVVIIAKTKGWGMWYKLGKAAIV